MDQTEVFSWEHIGKLLLVKGITGTFPSNFCHHYLLHCVSLQWLTLEIDCQPVCLSVCLSVCMTDWLANLLSDCLSGYWFKWLIGWLTVWLSDLLFDLSICLFQNRTLTLLTVRHLFTNFTSDGLYCCLHTESEPATIRLYLAVNKYTLESWAKHALKDPPPSDLNDLEPFEQRFSVDEGNMVIEILKLYLTKYS